LGDGLLTTDGDDWQWRRRIVNPAFHRQRVGEMLGTMIECGDRMAERLSVAARTGATIDLLTEMKLVTQDIISRTMFGIDIAHDADRIGAAVDEALQYVARRSRALINVPVNWPTPAKRRFDRALQDLDRAIYSSIRARRKSGSSGDDLLGMLLEAVDDETGRALSDDQVRNEVATVYGAGHETTANAVTWAWHELLQNPGVLATLQEEVDSVSPDEVEGLSYTRMVFEETLRFRPPVPINGRFTTEATELDGFEVAEGAVALLIVNNMHRHPDHWERPEEFYPEHFTSEAKGGRDRYAWTPFGAGPHLCIGNNFAMIEGTVLLSMMARRFEFEPTTPLPRKPALAVTLKPRGGLPVKVRER
jgi:cytochrome P450